MGHTPTRTGSRMDEPLSGTGAAPVVEQVAPGGDEFVVSDALAALLERGTTNSSLSTKQRETLIALAHYRASKSEFERRAKALGALITPAQAELLNLIGELELDFDHPFAPEDTGNGYEIRPYLRRPIWPAYKKDPDTEQKFTQLDLIDALYGSPAEHVVETKLNHKSWPAWVKKRVEAWRRRCGGPAGDGVRNAAGEFTDHDGNVLTEAERGDVTADELALPPELRRIVTVVELMEIHFTTAPTESAAVDALEAAEAAALAATGPTD